MAVKGDIDYGRLMQRAMRSVMVSALTHGMEHGTADGNYFYIAFETTHPGVDMPDWLKAQYPEEMTIVLQYEYSDLVVASDRFSVVMSFNNRPATLAIPFDAVRSFMDPHAEFGVKFDAKDADEGDFAPADPPASDQEEADPSASENEPEADQQEAGSVVQLDSFRKK